MHLIAATIKVPTPSQTVSLYPVACVHRDNPGHSKSVWQQFLSEVQCNPNAYVIGLGDYFDWLRTHAREYLRHYPHDRDSFKQLDKLQRATMEDFAKELMPIKTKILGLSLGNHHYEFSDGTNDVQYLCSLLQVPYLGKGCFMRLNIVTPIRTLKTFRILLHHGDGVGGNGARIGGDVNSLENKLMGFNFDIICLAHNHKRFGFHADRLTIPTKGELKLVDQPVAFIRAGCFVKGYVPDCVTYAESKLMNPTSIGYCRLDIRFKQEYDREQYQRARAEGKAKSNHGPGGISYSFSITS